MSTPIRQFSFSAGELSPTLFARTDLDRYANGVRTARNQMVMRQGGLTGRPGTQYAGTTLNQGNQVRLIPFTFNETGLGQSYILEFGNEYIVFYQNGGQVVVSQFTIVNALIDPLGLAAPGNTFANGDIVTVSGVIGTVGTQLNNQYFIVYNASSDVFSLKGLDGTILEGSGSYISGGVVSKILMVATPYIQADLQDLDYAQSADILTLVHPSYPPKELARSSALSWSLNAITFAPPVAGPSGVSVVGTAGSTLLGYAITSVNANGEESDNLQIGYGFAGLTVPSPTAPVTISWAQVSGAVYYRVYWDNHPVLIVPPGGRPVQLGFIGQVAGLSFVDSGFSPDFTNTPPLSTTSETPNEPFNIFSPLFSTVNNYPSTVGYVQQRRAFGATNNNPIGFWLSQTGDFSNFDTHISPTDSDGIISSLFSEEVNAIQHILELKFMLMLTAGAEIYVQGNGAGVVTPSAINASTQSQYGANSLRPLKVGDVLVFSQALGNAIRDFTFDFAIDGYRGNDITIFSAHLFEGYQIVDWCYQKIPDSIIWAVRSDGVLLSCTYVREQQILAWSRHDFTNGFVENICSIPENGAYAVYASIRRTINGFTVRYIERLSSRIWQQSPAIVAMGYPYRVNDPIVASYLDAYLMYDGRNVDNTIAFIITATGGFDTSDTAYQQVLTLTSQVSYFTPQMVGDQIFFTDSLFISSMGIEGNQIRLTIQSFVSATVVMVTPDTIVPTEFQDRLNDGWSHAVQTVSGLSHLEGQAVSVWADRFLVGSPLNFQVSTKYIVVNGSITLDKQYAVIYVGLPMIQDIEPLDLESYFGETMLAKRKRVSRLSVYVYNTRTFFAGSENPDTNQDNVNNDPLFQLYEEKDGRSQATYDVAPELLTEQDYVIVPSRWTKSGRCFFRNVDPVPFSLLALAPSTEDPVQTPYKRGG